MEYSVAVKQEMFEYNLFYTVHEVFLQTTKFYSPKLIEYHYTPENSILLR